MLLSLSLIFLVGLSLAAICARLKLPRIIGMLAAGIVLGPYVLNWLDPSVLGISSELRQMALIIILIKAGLSLNLSELKKVGRPAVLMSCVPACFEILGYVLLAPLILDVTRTEAAVMGAVLGAVSPAVVVPRMLRLMENRCGTDKGIPQLILAGASCDDIFVIVLFSGFLNMAQGDGVNVMDVVNLPISVLLGTAAGAICGLGLSFLFQTADARQYPIRDSMKVILILSFSFLLLSVEAWAKRFVPFSGLLAVMSMACVWNLRSRKAVSERLSETFGKLWLAAEVLLFVLVGAAVDLRYTFGAGIAAVGMIFIGLGFRAVGVAVCLIRTPLTLRERLFCIIAYLPKATVQAAIGSVPMSLGLPCGRIVLSVAVLSILITAPLGAFGMDATDRTLLASAHRKQSQDGT